MGSAILAKGDFLLPQIFFSTNIRNPMNVRCPHCQNQIEIVGDDPLKNVDCPSCGSSFNLAITSTCSFDSGSVQKVAHFELIRQVGMGAFGSVSEARDPNLDRTVALKLLRPDRTDSGSAERFLREARAAAQINHPNIVSVHEVGRHDDSIYIASDFIDGADLKQWLSGRRFTPREAAEFCAKIADALHAAHEAGVVHRDLKPGNIMMDANGEPHITDFGLAKRETGEITMTIDGHELGTPAYMPPEQVREAHKADRRSDVYSLGVILFELLTGELPFRGDTRMLLLQIQTEDPPPPRKFNQRIPRDLEAVCMKAMNREPNQRYQTAQDFRSDLQRQIAGEAVTARASGRLSAIVAWCRRPERVPDAGTVAIFAAIMGLISHAFGIIAQIFDFRAFDFDVHFRNYVLGTIAFIVAVEGPMLLIGLATRAWNPLAIWLGVIVAIAYIAHTFVWINPTLVGMDHDYWSFGGYFREPGLRINIGSLMVVISVVMLAAYATALFAYYSNPHIMRWYREKNVRLRSSTHSD